ncbi:MAG: DUF6036 family nucleotidyltransferase [Raineya sp.]
MLDFLEKVTNKLDLVQLPYMLSGSLAMGFYAIQRTTRDVDLVIEMQENKVQHFVNLFKEGYYCFEPAVREAIKTNSMFNVIDTSTGFKIDFILRKNSIYDKNAFNRRVIIEFDELTTKKFWVISIEDLIIAKIRWIQDLVSERQLEDIQNLLLNPTVDRNYLKYWIKELSLNTYQIKL